MPDLRNLPSLAALALGLLVQPALVPPALGQPAPPATTVREQTIRGETIHRVARTPGALRVDGNLDEPTWREALHLELPYEVMPGENTEPPVRTECLLLFDDENLYAAFVAHDPEPARIRARISDRDNLWGDDAVGLMLDCFNDSRRAFQFLVNPLGVQADILRNDLAGDEDESEDSTWDVIWNSAGRITAEGYVVELAIPFESLRFPRTDAEQTWGFSLFRDYPRGDRHQISLTPYDRSRNCNVCQYAKLTGLSGILPGRSIELDPTFTTLRHDERTAGNPASGPGGPSGGRWDRGEAEHDLGLSARWSVTPNLILNGALNPDFSQVEADAAQLDVNTRYALFYEERRPFFLEGADFFHTPLSAVHTRTVADPLWGAKLTGKEGRQAFGLVVTRDEQNNLSFPSNEGTTYAVFDEQVTGSMLRYRRDAGSASTLGALATLRESGRYHNRVGGLDGDFRLGDSDRCSVQFLGSATRYPVALVEKRAQPRGEFTGAAATAWYRHDARDWSWWGGYDDLGADFRGDAGYFPRVDTRTVEAGIHHTSWGAGDDWVRQWQLGLEGEGISDHGGTETDRNLALYSNLNGPRQLWLRSRYERKLERFGGRDYDLDFVTQRFSARPSGRLECWGVVAYGDGIDYANARRVDRHWGGPGGTVTLGRHVTFFLDHTYEHLSHDGRMIYFANLLQGRLVYQFTHRAFLRTVFQYTDVDYDPREFSRPMPQGERELFLQLLGSYKLNPQTVLYLGYSDHRSGPAARTMRITDRTLFGKIGYAWLI